MTDSNANAVPTDCLELRSTVTENGLVTLGLRSCEVGEMGPDQVVVRVEAAPINPSDLGMLFAGGDVATATAVDGDLAAVSVSLTPPVLAALAGRLGQVMPTGNEGAGTVVAAGSSPEAQQLLGKVVGFLSGNAYAEYRVLGAASCLAMAEGTTAAEAAAAFINPLTALGMVETMRAEGHTALVHTVGASNLGIMLNRICIADGVGLVNIVRKAEHVDLLRAQGAEHVCDSSSESFMDDLTDAMRATGATIGFDAIGGGDLANTLLTCMERVASEGDEFSRYGSSVHKQVYVYGGLDRSPTSIRRNFGMSWSVGGWLLTPFLLNLGQEGNDRLRQRVADEITTTFASSYGMTLSLTDVVNPEMVRRYGLVATGDKALLTPHA